MHILNNSSTATFLCKERASIAKRPKSTIIYAGGQANINGRMVETTQLSLTFQEDPTKHYKIKSTSLT